MRTAILLLCLFSVTGCGLAKRLIPKRPTPRVIITGGTVISQADDPCIIDEADAVLAAYYAQGSRLRLPS